MATTNLPATAYVPVGSEFEQGRPLGSRVRFNGEGGVRRAWWWEAGPVDSCCFCCSLAAGVAMLVLVDVLFFGIFKLYRLMAEHDEREGAMVYFKDKYAQECEGVEEPPPDCAGEAVILLHLTSTDDMYMTTLVQGLFSILFGVVGLWSVVTHNVFAAKVYLWSWPPRFLVELVAVIMQRFRLRHYHMGFMWKMHIIGALLNTAILAYCAKVTWSYHLMLKRKKRAALSASETAGGIELDGSTGTVV